jgi:hypothetical protein
MEARTPEEIFRHHADALTKADIDEIVADYADDAVLVTPDQVWRGKSGVREGFEVLLGLVPGADWDAPVAVFADDLLLIEWTARSARNDLVGGVDTFVFRDGLIRAQTIRYTVNPTDRIIGPASG